MPCISEFFGISVYFYFVDHPPPHFHAFYGEHEALIEISSLRIIRGSLPPRAYGLVVEWGMANRQALTRAWDQAAASQRIDRIDPLR